jgi:alanine racemase
MAWNLAQLRSVVGGSPIMGIIKCSAYGHGLLEVAKFLEGQSIDALAVAGAHAAIGLRKKGISCPLLNLGPFSAAEAEEIVVSGISQSVFTDEFSVLAEAAGKHQRAAKVHIKVDTGLGRLGVPHYEALPFIRRVAGEQRISIEGIFTTLTEDEDFDREQLARFLIVCDSANEEDIDLGLRHAASSAGILSFPDAFLDMVRPGITLYGHYPSEKARSERKITLRPAMQLKAPVLYVKKLRPGDGVSYHRPFVAERETNVATIGLGYSDGLPRALAQGGEVLIRGRRRSLIAAVTSNHCSANLFDSDDVEIGDEAVVFGKQGENEIDAADVAERAGVSVYKLLIGMNPLLPRRYARLE